MALAGNAATGWREFQRAERERIRAHLRSTERALRARSVVGLAPDVRTARAQNLAWLHEYWVRGEFPRNLDVPHRIPVLRDPFGTPCAVAYLVERSGGAPLIDELAASANHVYVDDVSSGPLLDWIGGSGLTQDECARIQPAYDPGPPPSLPPIDPPVPPPLLPPIDPPVPPPDVSSMPSLAGQELVLMAFFAAWTGLWLAWVLTRTGLLDLRRLRSRPRKGLVPQLTVD